MKDRVSHYIRPPKQLTSTAPQSFSNNLTMPASNVAVGIRGAMPPDRFRAVVTMLMTLTVDPVGKGHRVNGERFDPDRVHAEPK